MKVKDILATKGKKVITTRDDNSVFEAMSIFAANKVGSLLVLDKNDNIVGILAARDVLMAVLHSCEKIRETKVKQIMTKDIIVGSPEDDLDYVQAIMTENRIRHLPIMAKKELAGLISIGDIVKAQLTQTDVENRYLRDYIEGKYPA